MDSDWLSVVSVFGYIKNDFQATSCSGDQVVDVFLMSLQCAKIKMHQSRQRKLKSEHLAADYKQRANVLLDRLHSGVYTFL